MIVEIIGRSSEVLSEITVIGPSETSSEQLLGHYRCLRGNAPQYLVDCCKSTTDAVSRQRLRSASRHQLIVPRHRRTNFGRRAFTVAGPTAWNSLPDYLRRLAKTLLGDY